MNKRDAVSWKVKRIYGNKDSLEKILTCAASQYEEIVWGEFDALNRQCRCGRESMEKKSADRRCYAVQEEKQ